MTSSLLYFTPLCVCFDSLLKGNDEMVVELCDAIELLWTLSSWRDSATFRLIDSDLVFASFSD